MEIKVMIKGAVYSICIGYKLPWFRQLPFICIMREWFNDEMHVSFAVLIWHS